jgi:hypothetical protein
VSQHDYDIANASGASVRSDINSALAAIVSLNSGAAAPATTYAYMFWADTTNSVLKRRNAANSGWIVCGPLNSTMSSSKTSAYTVAVSDYGTTIQCTSGTFTLTLTAAATLADGFAFAVRNDGTGYITIDPNSSELIDGAASIILTPGESCVVWCNGSAFKTIGRGKIAQKVPFTITEYAEGTAQIPLDNTKPQIGEGFSVINGTMVVSHPSSRLLFDGDLNVAHSNGTLAISAALFQGTAADAISAAGIRVLEQNQPFKLRLEHSQSAGTNGTLVFSVRVGANASGTTSINGRQGTSLYGTIMTSRLTVTELLP